MDTLTPQEVAQLLGTSPNRVRQLLRDRKLMAVPGSGNGKIPAAFVQDGVILKHLPGLLTVLHDGGFNELMRQHEILRDRGADRVSPNFLPNVLVDSPSGQLAIELGIRGPNYAVVSACATGSHAIGEGAELIRNGHADAVLAGGTESCIHPLILAGFTNMRGLAAGNGDPTAASRPFDAKREGDAYELPDAVPSFMCPTPIGVAVRDETVRFDVKLLDAETEEVLVETTAEATPRCPPEGDPQRTYCLQICSG